MFGRLMTYQLAHSGLLLFASPNNQRGMNFRSRLGPRAAGAAVHHRTLVSQIPSSKVASNDLIDF